MDNCFCELNGYTVRESEDQIIDFPISLRDMVLSKSYINGYFVGINRFYEVNDLVLEI